MGVGKMAENEKNLIDALKSVEVWLLAVLLVLTLGAAFSRMGLGVIGLLIGIFLVLRLVRMTGLGGSQFAKVLILLVGVAGRR
jgi:hypothetical protein